jgi:hypothetical protein
MSSKWNKHLIENLNAKRHDNSFGFKDSIRFNTNRFHAIYFIDSLTGALLVSNKFSNGFSGGFGLSETDDDLISGFLNAITMFIREIRKNEYEEIQEINFSDTRILYEKRGRLLCIGITKKTDLKIERDMLHDVIHDFYDRFESEINHFNGFISPAIMNYKFRLNSVNFDMDL